jgi:ParB family chromosome partitioning protein
MSNTMERRLGRGLGSLLSKPASNEQPSELALDRIRPNPFQPRTTFDEEGLRELQASIEAHGILQPIVVRLAPPDGEGPVYELVSGERRCRASRLAGRTTIPAVVRTGVRDDEMLELALVENVQRRDLDPIERGRGFRQLLEALNLTQEEVAKRVGLQRSTITNHLRLLDLPDSVQDAVAAGLLGMGHARALLGIEDPGAQELLFQQTVRGDFSVREVERRVRALNRPEEPSASEKRGQEAREPWVGEIEARMRESLGTKVRIQNAAGFRGQIVLEYYDQASLDSLIARLAPQKTL